MDRDIWKLFLNNTHNTTAYRVFLIDRGILFENLYCEVLYFSTFCNLE
jgi:hypothetical protein